MTRYRIEGKVRKAMPCQPYEMINSVSNPKDINFDMVDYDVAMTPTGNGEWVRFEDIESLMCAASRLAQAAEENKLFQGRVVPWIMYAHDSIFQVIAEFKEAMRK
jgi:hypothetical protein